MNGCFIVFPKCRRARRMPELAPFAHLLALGQPYHVEHLPVVPKRQEGVCNDEARGGHGGDADPRKRRVSDAVEAAKACFLSPRWRINGAEGVIARRVTTVRVGGGVRSGVRLLLRESGRPFWRHGRFTSTSSPPSAAAAEVVLDDDDLSATLLL